MAWQSSRDVDDMLSKWQLNAGDSGTSCPTMKNKFLQTGDGEGV